MGKKKKAADRLVVQNAAKTLFANIRFASVDNPIRSLVLTSSVPNEGKSTVSMQLAAAIAQSGKRVLLVEVDMRRRSLADMLGVHTRGGLYAVLSEQMPLRSAIVPTSQGFDFLDSEPHIPNPVDILASKRFASLVDRLSRDYDFVVYDTRPLERSLMLRCSRRSSMPRRSLFARTLLVAMKSRMPMSSCVRPMQM